MKFKKANDEGESFEVIKSSSAAGGETIELDDPAGATVSNIQAFERKLKHEFATLNINLQKELHDAFCIIGGFTSGKRRQSNCRELGSGTCEGFLNFQYLRVLQGWIGITSQCDCNAKQVFEDLRVPNKSRHRITLGMGFSSGANKEAHIRGVKLICGQKHAYGKPLPGVGLVALAFKGAGEVHSGGFPSAVTSNVSHKSMGEITSILNDQYSYCLESGYTLPPGLRQECLKMVQVYRAYLEAKGRSREVEVINKTPSLKGVGPLPTVRAQFEKEIGKTEKNQFRFRPPESTIEAEYSKEVDETALAAQKISARLMAIRDLYSNIPAAAEIADITERAAQLRSVLSMDLSDLLDT